MGKKYFDTKDTTLESSILSVWQEAAKKNEDKLDPVNKDAVKKKFKDRKDKDIDNDGDTDDSDEYLHNRRKTVSKAVKGKVKDEGNAFGKALKDAKDKGDKTFVVSGKTYEVTEADDFKPHMMYDPKTGKGYKADTMDDHLRMKKMGYTHDAPKTEEVEVDEAYEIGTDEYRKYASDLTPGETDPEWVQARDFKVASMKEALAKVWGLDEKVLDKTSKENYDEEDEELKPVKGSKTMTGGKVAKIDTKPKMD